MVFNDTTTKNGVIQQCEDWLFGNNYGAISSNTDLLKKFTNLYNRGLDKTRAVLLSVDGRFQDDDPNYTTIPTDTTPLSDGVGSYTLNRSHGIIEGFEVLDSNGDYYPLQPLDYRDVRNMGTTTTEFMETSGRPVFYDVSGNVVNLYPAPATGQVTMVAGLKVVYKREPKYAIYTDTSTEVGVPRMFQDVPGLYACQEYAKQNSMSEKAREIDAEIEKRNRDLKKLVADRNKDEKLSLKPRRKRVL